MPLYIEIAKRYLFSVKNKALSFMTIISLIGIIVGVSALIITLGVMNGFQYGLKQKILETAPHIVIMKVVDNFPLKEVDKLALKLSAIREIEDFEPFIYSQALASVGSTVESVFVRGVDPEKDKKIMGIHKHVISGNYDSIKKDNTVIIGKDLAMALGLSIGDTFNLMSPFGRKTPFGYIPKILKVKVGAIAYFGMFEYDTSFVGMNLQTAQRLLDMKGKITGIQIKLKDPYKAQVVKAQLEKVLDPIYIVRTWIDMNKSLFQALKFEKLAMFLVITLIVIVASFNISSLLITKAREKRKDVAILKTIGADKSFILKIFLWQGMILGILGTIIGVIIGVAVVYIADTYHLVKLNPEVYMMSYLPLKVSLGDVFVVAVSSLVICFISSIIPAYFASKEIPAEVLRYE